MRKKMTAMQLEFCKIYLSAGENNATQAAIAVGAKKKVRE